MSLNSTKISASESNLTQFLYDICNDVKLHSLWLNTLSLLEHIGSRKILLTQSNENTSEMILRHATEEARHALFFKKAARTINSDFKSGYHNNELLKGNSAKIYFAKLDASVRRNLRKDLFSDSDFTYLAYLYTTTIIEKRAMIVYELYNQILIEKEFDFNLTNLILEEDGHLNEMSSELIKIDSKFEFRLSELINMEQKLFDKFFTQLSLIAA